MTPRLVAHKKPGAEDQGNGEKTLRNQRVQAPGLGTPLTSQAGLLQVPGTLKIDVGMQFDVLLQPAAQSLPAKRDRVRNSTPSHINYRIDQAMMKRIWAHARKSREEITFRIEQLDREWDLGESP